MIAEIGENQSVQKKLRGVAAKMTADPELQKDLVQEMWPHLLQVQRDQPDKTFGWYLKSCEFRARNFLRLGRSIDSYKRSTKAVRPVPGQDCDNGEFYHEEFFNRLENGHPHAARREFIRDDMLQLITPRLSERQRTILTSLMEGSGVREVARQLGISHPAVIKHRRKIASIAREFLAESTSASASCGSV
ncbi:MAG: sigma-70 family RNA polymerase sigma factor [Verrucomicrobiae bacterium]|nr:sigma-70 family RNA polymerase sigma factor [Verrucomicrobiae bacterium]